MLVDHRHAHVGAQDTLVTFIPMRLPRADGIRLLATKINKLVTPGAKNSMELERAAFRLISKIFDAFCFCAPDFTNSDTHNRICD